MEEGEGEGEGEGDGHGEEEEEEEEEEQEGEELRAHILDKLSAERSKRSFKILEMEEAIKA